MTRSDSEQHGAGCTEDDVMTDEPREPQDARVVYPVFMNDGSPYDELVAVFSTREKADAFCASHPKLVVAHWLPNGGMVVDEQEDR